MINRVMLLGQLKTIPQIKMLASGIKMAKLTVEVREGDGPNKNQWINVNAFNHAAENVETFLKDDWLAVEGKMETRKFEDKGVKHYYTYVNAFKVKKISFEQTSVKTEDKQTQTDDELGF